ncbi:hypothetical protein NQ318_006125 [Aromia moschata]|uniref:C2H2-type domain-containing protein n=1 Tax=Aromia moschata TaxID=1265417 RepID=A0AAV8Z2A9_9CUCU|nr:hypothetical protein NQ318_006125 [Aromia moschata]
MPPTLENLLQNPKKSKKSRENGSMKRLKLISEHTVRPGYSPDSQFACRYCGKRYKWKSTMRRHEQDECGDKEPKFQCSYCPYKAKQKGNLGVHVRKHHSPPGTALERCQVRP